MPWPVWRCPLSKSSLPDDTGAAFTRDVIRCLRQQYVALDYQDLEAVSSSLCIPRLGMVLATGPGSAVAAADETVRQAGALGPSSLVVVTCTADRGKLAESKSAMNALGARCRR